MRGYAHPERAASVGPVIAVATLGAALVATGVAGVPLRDPGGVTARRLAVAVGLVVLLAGLDLLIRARRRSGRLRGVGAELAGVRRERWPARRLAVVAGAILSFHVTYLAYRNLKSVVPLLEPDVSFDGRLGRFDRDLLGGETPAALLQSVLGTAASAHVLSAVYLAFFAFVPLALAAALVLVVDPRLGLLVATAFALNWLLAAGSYYLLPSVGPIYAEPGLFTSLPHTPVADLQARLLDERVAYLRDPEAAGAAQSIGAFGSLHTSYVLTAALAVHVLGLRRHVRFAAWTLVVLTVVATLYFGWHYLLDDVAGVLIAVLALVLASALTGVPLRRARQAPLPIRVPA